MTKNFQIVENDYSEKQSEKKCGTTAFYAVVKCSGKEISITCWCKTLPYGSFWKVFENLYKFLKDPITSYYMNIWLKKNIFFKFSAGFEKQSFQSILIARIWMSKKSICRCLRSNTKWNYNFVTKNIFLWIVLQGTETQVLIFLPSIIQRPKIVR